LPVDDSLNVKTDSLLDNIDEIDKKAVKAIKTLDELNKKSGKTKDTEIKNILKDTSTSDDKVADKIKNSVKDNIKKDDSFFSDAFESNTGRNLLSFGKNPKAFAVGLLKGIPFIGGIVAATEFAQAIIAELEKIDRFFKAFIPIIDNRINQLRKVEEQAKIRAGDVQLITTTQAGGTEPPET